MKSLRCARGLFCARAFVQIATRAYTTLTVQSPGPLYFLSPRDAGFSALRPTVTSSYRSSHGARSPRSQLVRRSSRRSQFRHFAASAIRNATRCIVNPRQDEKGEEMMLEITPRAAKRLSEIMKTDNNPNLALRIRVESGGCHGFQYLMSLVTISGSDPQQWTSAVSDKDTVFQHYLEDANNETQAQNGPKVVLDEPSLGLLRGSKVDYTTELIGSQFKIVDNPYATSSCGCGSSFDIKGW